MTAQKVKLAPIQISVSTHSDVTMCVASALSHPAIRRLAA